MATAAPSSALAIAQEQATQALAASRVQKKSARAGEEFEGMFLSQMLQPMFAGVMDGGEFGGGTGEETFRTMLVSEYGKLIAKSGGLGIAGAVRTELLRMQEHA